MSHIEPAGSDSNSLNGRNAAAIFWLSVLSLLCLAGLLHFSDNPDHSVVVAVCGLGFMTVSLLFCSIALRTTVQTGKLLHIGWLYFAFPPLRMVERNGATNSKVWLPGLGWREANHDLESDLDRISSIPMIAMALMVLPLIGVEYLWSDKLGKHPVMSGVLSSAAGLIWFAFAMEFIVRISIAKNKKDYCLKHWIDLAIVLLPLISFLRAVQLGRLLRLQQLTRTARLYRLRGVALRAWKALLVIEAVNRIMNGPPGRRLEKLRSTIESKQQELDDLRAELAQLESLVGNQSAVATDVISEKSAA